MSKITRVKDVLTEDVITFSEDASVYDCARILREKRISGAPVVDESNEVVGILSEGDIMKLIESKDADISLILPSPLDVLELPVRMKLKLDDIAKKAAKYTPHKEKEKDEKKEKKAEDFPPVHIAEMFLMETGLINRLPVMDEN